MKKHPLAAYRAQNGLTQQQFAWRAGITKGQISKVESGKVTPRADNLEKIEKATQGQVTVGALVEAAIAIRAAYTVHAAGRIDVNIPTGTPQTSGAAGLSEQPQQQYEPTEGMAMSAYEAKVAKGMEMLEQLYSKVGGLVTFAPGFDPAEPWHDEEWPNPHLPDDMVDETAGEHDGR